MPDEKHDDTSLDRPSGFMARRIRELAQRARGLKLADDVEVVFPDKNLEAAIRKQLEKPEGSITRGDLKGLGKLETPGVQIENLSGLEHAVNLTNLDLGDNQISDISSLASLTNLTWLHLSDNQISDVSSLASLTNLIRLGLSNNPLNEEAIDIHVPALKARGVRVTL